VLRTYTYDTYKYPGLGWVLVACVLCFHPLKTKKIKGLVLHAGAGGREPNHHNNALLYCR
jgi:hypothetical protein